MAQLRAEMEPSLANTRASRVAGVIRRRVLSGPLGYEAGAWIFPQRLTADLGVSMTPVREALQLLSA